MSLSPEWITLLSLLGPALIAIAGFVIQYRALSGKLETEKLAALAVVEKDKVAAKATVDEAAAEALDKARRELDHRNKEMMDGVIADNKDLNKRVGQLQDDADRRREADAKKDTLVAALQAELKSTATDCKAEIAKVLAELVQVRERLGIALSDKSKAEAAASVATAPPAGAPTGQVAEGTVAISLEVKKKEE